MIDPAGIFATYHISRKRRGKRNRKNIVHDGDVSLAFVGEFDGLGKTQHAVSI